MTKLMVPGSHDSATGPTAPAQELALLRMAMAATQGSAPMTLMLADRRFLAMVPTLTLMVRPLVIVAHLLG